VTRDVHPPQLQCGREFDFIKGSRLSSASGGQPVSGNFINGSPLWRLIVLSVGSVLGRRVTGNSVRHIGGPYPPIRRCPAGPTGRLSGAVFSRREKITPSGSRAYAIDPFRLPCVAASVSLFLSPSTVRGAGVAKQSVASAEHGL
jgi:hypothetical protein